VTIQARLADPRRSVGAGRPDQIAAQNARLAAIAREIAAAEEVRLSASAAPEEARV
jgi:hypothetical protein